MIKDYKPFVLVGGKIIHKNTVEAVFVNSNNFVTIKTVNNNVYVLNTNDLTLVLNALNE